LRVAGWWCGWHPLVARPVGAAGWLGGAGVAARRPGAAGSGRRDPQLPGRVLTAR